jgi:hypothetical protein
MNLVPFTVKENSNEILNVNVFKRNDIPKTMDPPLTLETNRIESHKLEGEEEQITPRFTKDEKFWKIGLRGACGYIDENTIASIKYSLFIGVDAVYLDVKRCSSGELIIFADDSIERMIRLPKDYTGPLLISDLSYMELSKLRTINGHRIPLLKDIIETIFSKAIIFLQIDDEKAVESTLTLIKKYVSLSKLSFPKFAIFTSIERIAYDLILYRKTYMSPNIEYGFMYPLVKNLSSKISEYSFREMLRLIDLIQGSFIIISSDILLSEGSKSIFEISYALDLLLISLNNYFVHKDIEEITINFLQTLPINGIISSYPDKVTFFK